jgi:CRP/FNR family transcriptional regulator, cyclic AMP receptor protein
MSHLETAEFFFKHCASDHGADALFLPHWSAQDWATLLALAKPVTLASNAVLMKRGQTEQSLFLVARGALDVSAGGGGSAMGSLFREGPGAVIGEIAFFDSGARSATAWAVEPTQLLALERKDVDTFAAAHAARGLELLFALGRVLAFRVRRSEHLRRADAF